MELQGFPPIPTFPLKSRGGEGEQGSKGAGERENFAFVCLFLSLPLPLSPLLPSCLFLAGGKGTSGIALDNVPISCGPI